jgi:hypothetical protein
MGIPHVSHLLPFAGGRSHFRESRPISDTSQRPSHAARAACRAGALAQAGLASDQFPLVCELTLKLTMSSSGGDDATIPRFSILFWNIGNEQLQGSDMDYKGIKQNGEFMCVFASVAGAINSVAGKDVWTQDGLLQKWREQGIPDVKLNFSNLHAVALQPVNSQLKSEHYVDNSAPMSDEAYLKLIKDCVDGGGVAILSLQHADLAGSTLNRKQSWHMLSLFRRKGDDFEAWDTAGENTIRLSAKELVTHFRYGGGVLAVDEKHDLLLVKPL